MEQTGCSETLAHKIQTPGNCPEESMQQSRLVLENASYDCIQEFFVLPVLSQK